MKKVKYSTIQYSFRLSGKEGFKFRKHSDFLLCKYNLPGNELSLI